MERGKASLRSEKDPCRLNQLEGKMSHPDMFNDIISFHSKFQLPVMEFPSFSSEEIMEFRIKFLQEEVWEFISAYKDKNVVDAFDALIDLVYVALGTARMMNLPWDEGWKIVHAANMSKLRVERKELSSRGSIYDVVKPEGFVKPEMMLQALLLRVEYELRIVKQKNYTPPPVAEEL